MSTLASRDILPVSVLLSHTAFGLGLVAGLLSATASGAALLRGRVVNIANDPIAGAAILASSLRLQPCCGPEYTLLTDFTGQFAGEVEAGEYVLHVTGPGHLGAQQRRLVVPASGVSGVDLQLIPEPFVFIPDRPPTAALITISPPTSAGQVSITGATGAVGGDSFVLVTTLDTGDFSWTAATGGGAFSLDHHAPPGSSVLVQADPLGFATRRLLVEIATACCEGGAASSVGTILRVPDAPASSGGRPVSGVAGPCKRGYPSLSFQGVIAPAIIDPGDTFTLDGTLRAHSPGFTESVIEVEAFLFLLTVAYADGTTGSANTFLASHLLTTTGLPIERSARSGERVGVGLGRRRLERISPGEYADTVVVQMSIPADLPIGFYHPILAVSPAGVDCRAMPGVPVALVDRIDRRATKLYLPPMRIGTPQPPRLFWSLLTDTLSNGSPGVTALEDQSRYGLSPRILTPSHILVVPRRHPASGTPLRYRLEPFLPLVSIGERGVPPDSPLIPFRLPSGELRLLLKAPDGTEVRAGPAPFVQSRVRTPVDGRGDIFGLGGGSMANVFQLSTMDPAFVVSFEQDGLYEARLEGWAEDVTGQRWNGGGTYRIWVADPLVLDTATLPGTPFEVGDRMHLGVQLVPPVPADFEVLVRFAPASAPLVLGETRIRGRANRFGFFSSVNGFLAPSEPGEYRVDMVASFRDEQGRLRQGARTWGGVVAAPNPRLVAHGRRCTDGCELGPQWFDRAQIGFAFDHLFFPFHRGDIAWQVEERDAARLALTVQDPSLSVTELLRSRIGSPEFDARAAAGEIPLVSSRAGGQEPHLDPAAVDLWAYSYRSAQRPLVRVREMVGEDGLTSEYWRFNDQYTSQAGVGELGDLANDFKFLFGGAVLRGSALSRPEYAIYGSLWVHLPADDPIERSRVFPPFRGNGGGAFGGADHDAQGAGHRSLLASDRGATGNDPRDRQPRQFCGVLWADLAV